MCIVALDFFEELTVSSSLINSAHTWKRDHHDAKRIRKLREIVQYMCSILPNCSPLMRHTYFMILLSTIIIIKSNEVNILRIPFNVLCQIFW